jgi:hypothetical protein
MLFPAKTGIYIPNNFNGLDRRPFGVYVKDSENFARYFSRFNLKFGGSDRVKCSLGVLGISTQGFSH